MGPSDSCVGCDIRWADELEGVVPGAGLAAHGECPLWHHLLVRWQSLLCRH